MLIEINGKPLHYYEYDGKIIVERNDLCSLLDSDHAKSLTQKISMNLDRPSEQLTVSRSTFASIGGLEADFGSSPATQVSFVTIEGIKALLSHRPPFGKRIFDFDAVDALNKLFFNTNVMDCQDMSDIKAVENTVEETAAVVYAEVPETNEAVLIDEPETYEVSGPANSADNAIISNENDVLVEYILHPDVVKAVKLKAVNEDRLVDEVVEELLRAGIEKKYFNL